MPNDFGARLAGARKLSGLSQREVAERAGVSREYVARVEAGRQDPTIAVAERLARAAGRELAEILRMIGEEGERRKAK